MSAYGIARQILGLPPTVAAKPVVLNATRSIPSRPNSKPTGYQTTYYNPPINQYYRYPEGPGTQRPIVLGPHSANGQVSISFGPTVPASSPRDLSAHGPEVQRDLSAFGPNY